LLLSPRWGKSVAVFFVWPPCFLVFSFRFFFLPGFLREPGWRFGASSYWPASVFFPSCLSSFFLTPGPRCGDAFSFFFFGGWAPAGRAVPSSPFRASPSGTLLRLDSFFFASQWVFCAFLPSRFFPPPLYSIVFALFFFPHVSLFIYGPWIFVLTVCPDCSLPLLFLLIFFFHCKKYIPPLFGCSVGLSEPGCVRLAPFYYEQPSKICLLFPTHQ